VVTTILHTADWHLGKTFESRSGDPDTQAQLRRARFDAVDHLATLARDCNAAAVLVAGDVFHSNEVEDKSIIDALKRIGSIPAPVIAIPGNHDHAGAGSVWERRTLENYRGAYAPNLRVVRDGIEVVPIGMIDVIASPVRQRFHQQALEELGNFPSEPGRVRIGLVHAACLSFNEDETGRELRLTGQEAAKLSYLALGDFHRVQRVEGIHCEAWYAGALEPDNYPSHHQVGIRSGTCVRVAVDANGGVSTQPLELKGSVRWARVTRNLRDGAAIAELVATLRELVAGGVRTTMCQVDLDDSILGLAATHELEAALDELAPHFLALERTGAITLEPTSDELAALVERPGLAGLAARRLRERIDQGGADEAAARCALARLHELVTAQDTESVR
jgi:DNA repair exonuclease SbcCD nuclease subunit